MSHMNLQHARSDEQREQMVEIDRLGICPFCREHFDAHHRNKILYENSSWLVTKNDFPYDGVVEQLLIVPIEHVMSPAELSPESWYNLHYVMKWVQIHVVIPGGSFVMRFGNTDYTGGTVSHFHIHAIFGVSSKMGTESLKVKVGYKSPEK